MTAYFSTAKWNTLCGLRDSFYYWHIKKLFFCSERQHVEGHCWVWCQTLEGEKKNAEHYWTCSFANSVTTSYTFTHLYCRYHCTWCHLGQIYPWKKTNVKEAKLNTVRVMYCRHSDTPLLYATAEALNTSSTQWYPYTSAWAVTTPPLPFLNGFISVRSARTHYSWQEKTSAIILPLHWWTYVRALSLRPAL